MEATIKINNLSFTKDKLKSLKESYNKATSEKKDTFIFEGSILLTSYAKYMIEYLGTIKNLK